MGFANISPGPTSLVGLISENPGMRILMTPSQVILKAFLILFKFLVSLILSNSLMISCY